MLLVSLIGFTLGFFGSVPIAGPIAALVLRHGLQGRTRAGLYVALGAAVAEGIYAYLAFWGFGELLGGYAWVEPASRIMGAILLTCLGALFVVRPPTAGKRPDDAPNTSQGSVGLKRSLAVGFTVTCLNPTLLATWGAAVTMAYSVLPIDLSQGHALPFALGAFIGIAIWFAIFVALLERFSDRMRPQTVARVARATGACLVALGLSATVQTSLHMLSNEAGPGEPPPTAESVQPSSNGDDVGHGRGSLVHVSPAPRSNGR